MLRIKEVAKEKGISMEEIANTLGINRVSLSRNINGNPTIETLGKIAEVLRVDVKDFFVSSNEDIPIKGFVKVGNTIHEIGSTEDLEKLLELTKGE
ncbi:helix-turn-helix domain-containing protein [Maribacter sp. 2307UL18-2]|uniref:helix-turn-helix domain-containing protein n=1 Tax=Maribacter sp. 2307UL18-2 TaxID=3386274 RepID=UPI0039BD8005